LNGAAESSATDPLPTLAEALDERSAPSSWFLRIECERCGKVRLVNQVYAVVRSDSADGREIALCGTAEAPAICAGSAGCGEQRGSSLVIRHHLLIMAFQSSLGSLLA